MLCRTAFVLCTSGGAQVLDCLVALAQICHTVSLRTHLHLLHVGWHTVPQVNAW